jgi:hypothetical protein
MKQLSSYAMVLPTAAAIILSSSMSALNWSG